MISIICQEIFTKLKKYKRTISVSKIYEHFLFSLSVPQILVLRRILICLLPFIWKRNWNFILYLKLFRHFIPDLCVLSTSILTSHYYKDGFPPSEHQKNGNIFKEKSLIFFFPCTKVIVCLRTFFLNVRANSV